MNKWAIFIFTLFVIIMSQQTHASPFQDKHDHEKHEDLIRQPQNCELNCLISTLENPVTLEIYGIHLGKKSTLYVDNEGKVILLKGQILVSKKNQVIQTEFGSITIVGKSNIVGEINSASGLDSFTELDSDVLIVRETQRVTVSVLKGSVIISKRRSEDKEVKLNAGQSLWVGPITSAGYNAEGLPQAVKLSKIEKTLKKTLNKSEFEVQARMVLHEQSRWIASISEVYAEVNKQLIAKQEMERAAHEARKKEEQDQRQRVRQLFRHKYLSPPEELLLLDSQK